MLKIARNDVPLRTVAATFHFGITVDATCPAAPLRKEIVQQQIVVIWEYLEDLKNVIDYQRGGLNENLWLMKELESRAILEAPAGKRLLNAKHGVIIQSYGSLYPFSCFTLIKYSYTAHVNCFFPELCIIKDEVSLKDDSTKKTKR